MKKPPHNFLQYAIQSLQRGALEDAESQCEKALALEPSSPDALHIRAVILLQQGKAAEALEWMKRAIEVDPENASRHNDLGEILRGARQVSAAEQAYRRAIALNPELAIAHNNLGICLHELGNRAAARDAYRRAIALQPDYAEANFNLASSFVDEQAFADAEACLRISDRASPGNVRVLSLLGLCCLKLQRPQQAIGWYQSAIARTPDDAALYADLAKACAAAGQHGAAAEALAQAIQRAPGREEHHFHMAEALKALGRFDEALPYMQEALKLRPGSHEIANNLGNLLRTMGRIQEAEAILRQAIAWKPEFSPLYNNLGMICIETERVDEAFKCFQEALRLNPQSVEAYGNLANTYRHMGDFEQAKRHYARALELRPDYAAARFSWSITQLGTGDFASGWANYRYRQGALEEKPERFLREPLPQDLTGKRIYIGYDQGIGDEIFFLRFAEALKQRGAWIAYRSFPKIASLLSRLPFIDMQVGPEELKPEAYDQTVWVSDLAYAAGMCDDAAPPPSITLRTTPGARRAVSQRLAGMGGGPYLGVTWRAGTPRDVSTPWRALYKEVPLEQLAQAVKGYPGKIFVLQRNPKAGEIETFARISGCQVVDFSDLNEQLEQMLALLDVLDEHVCVSNTNVHLRAALGKTSRVIIPNPPDWRWMTSGVSPWFPGCPTYRQKPGGDWSAAFDDLRAALMLPEGAVASSVAEQSTVLWLTMEAPGTDAGGVTSSMASMRYRVLTPMQALAGAGIKSVVQSFSDARTCPTVADCVVVSKTLDPADLEVVDKVRKPGTRLIVDLCDNHFDRPEVGGFHRKLLSMADVVVASTTEMASVIRREGRDDARVIGDPYESRRGVPRFSPDATRLNLLWFGHPSNLVSLVQSLPGLAGLAARQSLHLEVVSSISPELMFVLNQENRSWLCNALDVTLTPWSQMAMQKAFARSDLVMIPTMAEARKLVKSPNRLVESLWSGRFVIAGSIPAYEDFKDWAWIGEDMGSGVEWALSHQDEIPERIAAAQNFIAAHYSPEVIGMKWKAAIEA